MMQIWTWMNLLYNEVNQDSANASVDSWQLSLHLQAHEHTHLFAWANVICTLPPVYGHQVSYLVMRFQFGSVKDYLHLNE